MASNNDVMQKWGFIITIILSMWVMVVEADTECSRVYGAIGAEDINVDAKNGIAYISSQDRRSKPILPGAIYALDLKEVNSKPIKIDINEPKIFHPHGMYLYQKDDERYLYVVNHRSHDEQSIEVFAVNGYKLKHLASLADSKLTDPNDIFVIDRNKFYVTNYTHADVLFYNNGIWSIVEKFIPFANGIGGHRDKQELLILSSMTRKVYRYKYNPETGALKPIENFSIGFFGDNIEAGKGSIYWIAGHTNPLLFILHQFFPSIKSPSKVIKLTFDDKNEYKEEVMLANNGSLISGSSVAVPYKNEFLVGSVFEKYFLRCKIMRREH